MTLDKNSEHAMREAGIPAGGPWDHEYKPTMYNLCERPNCRRPQGEHRPGVSQPALMERRMATGVYAGPTSGPGRGGLSPAWVEWALKHPWLRDGR